MPALKPENRDLLNQFFADLRAQYNYLAIEGATAEGGSQENNHRLNTQRTRARAEVLSILKEWTEKPAEMVWRDAYECERYMICLLTDAELKVEVARRRTALKQIEPEKEVGLPESPDPKADDYDAEAARSLLHQMLSDLHWSYSQRYHARSFVQSYARRLIGLLCIGGLLAAGAVIALEKPEQGWFPAGMIVAGTAGFLGALVSMLIRLRDSGVGYSLEDIRINTGWPMSILRMGTGLASAVILYFIFNTGLIEGSVFPDLTRIGYVEVRLNNGFVPGDTGSRPAAATRASTVPDPSARESETPTVPVSPGSEFTALGRHVPGKDLCLLVVFCFLAGFAESFVPALLGRIEKQRSGIAT